MKTFKLIIRNSNGQIESQGKLKALNYESAQQMAQSLVYPDQVYTLKSVRSPFVTGFVLIVIVILLYLLTTKSNNHHAIPYLLS